MWGGHSLSAAFEVDFVASATVKASKTKVKGGGRECPPHTHIYGGQMTKSCDVGCGSGLACRAVGCGRASEIDTQKSVMTVRVLQVGDVFGFWPRARNQRTHQGRKVQRNRAVGGTDRRCPPDAGHGQGGIGQGPGRDPGNHAGAEGARYRPVSRNTFPFDRGRTRRQRAAGRSPEI